MLNNHIKTFCANICSQYGPADKNVPVKKLRLGSVGKLRNCHKKLGYFHSLAQDKKWQNENHATLGCSWYKKQGLGAAAGQ